jgi:broad specificity phosphatase PhoE
LIVRHGESLGNVARRAAEQDGVLDIDVGVRDMDVPLSEAGERQADAVGLWLGALGRRAPTTVLSSPYVRAEQTTARALRAAGLDLPVTLDERLREREFGVLDRLTHLGVAQRHPEQAELRARVGKFYHRPPGGESWCDVVLRIRSVLDTVSREHGGEHVLVVAHQVVVFAFRYVLEQLREGELLAIARDHPLVNAGITSYVADRRSGGMRLERFDEVPPVQETGAPVTHEGDVPVAPR